MVNNKKCIAVLTRGYNDTSDYHKLIKRNKCIEQKMSHLEKKIIHDIFYKNSNN